MDIEIADPSLLMIFLLEECDLDCPHCVRTAEPMAPGYRLTLEQFRAGLRDGRALPSVSWMHFSLGEPMLWRVREFAGGKPRAASAMEPFEFRTDAWGREAPADSAAAAVIPGAGD